ncbi:hypothetical protein FO519_006010 [Halicephalobus sp. NKZ332]|nr:hypothetical protein FO519_006010 [Halicephalobus sp. NKZ332]
MDIAEKCQTVIWQLPNESVIYNILLEVHKAYRPVHTYLSIFICALGAVCNFCNIVVLTRKTMRTPVNMILTAMACCDTVVLFSNLIYTTHYTFVAVADCHPRHWSYGWAMFLIAHAHLSLVGHSSSIWLSVMLALIRYLTLRSRGNLNGVQIGPKHSYIAIASVIVFVSVMNTPNFLTYKITEIPLIANCHIKDPELINALAYVPGVSEMAVQAGCLVFRMAFWISGTLFKLVPCMLLTIFVLLLMKILNEVKQNRNRLLKNSRTGTHTNGSVSPSAFEAKAGKSNGTQLQNSLYRNNSVKNGKGHHGGGGGRADRTTKMLLVIVGVFLVTELPQGIMAVLSGMFSEEYRRNVYNNLGDILDLLALCNACTTFIIYCTMSAQFRNEFRRVFMPATVKCWLAPESVRRCSETYLPGSTKTGVSYLRPSTMENNDHSITLTVVGSTNSVRKLCPNGDSPRNEEGRVSASLVENNDRLLAPSDYNSGGSMASTLTVDGDEKVHLLNGVPIDG